MAIPKHLQKPDPTPTVIGSLAEAWRNIPGQLTVAVGSAIALSPFKESDIDLAAAGSLLKHELDKGTFPLMLRARLEAISSSVSIRIKAAKAEAVGDTTPEKFYDEIVEVTFTTSANAIEAERGGFYADGFAIVGTDNTLKGVASVNRYAKCTFVDVLGFLSLAFECSALATAAWVEIDITNS